MGIGDPTNWPHVYSKDNFSVTLSPNDLYYFFNEIGERQFLFYAEREILYKIAESNEQSCSLLAKILKNFPFYRRITSQQIVQFIKDANWVKAFDKKDG